MADFKVGDRVRKKARNCHDYGIIRKVLPRKKAVEVTWEHKSRFLLVEQPFDQIEHPPVVKGPVLSMEDE